MLYISQYELSNEVHEFKKNYIFALVCLFVCLLGWWAGNCSITESLPELIQQVRQDLAGTPGGKFAISRPVRQALLSLSPDWPGTKL